MTKFNIARGLSSSYADVIRINFVPIITVCIQNETIIYKIVINKRFAYIVW